MAIATLFSEWVFWICASLIVYSYLAYPVLLFVAYSLSQIRRDWRYLTQRRERRVSSPEPEQLPEVSLVIAAYNEEDRLPEKLANLQQLDFPPEKLEVILVSDGSTDRTNHILSATEDPKIRSILLPDRKGKPTALNHGVAHASHEVLVFSDGATLFEPHAVKNLVRHFSDPAVGVVCGALGFEATPESRQTEGVYWKYESMLRLMESRLGATLTASGAIYALRRCCFQELAPNTVIEDFVIPMNARKLGYRVVYDPEAVGTEFAAPTVSGEFTRRVRLAVGSFRALRELTRVPLDGSATFAFASHKLARWIVPFMLIGLLFSDILLLANVFYRLVFICQFLFYIWAGLGFVFRKQAQGVRFALIGYFLLAMNLAFLVGFFRFVTGREEVTWERAH